MYGASVSSRIRNGWGGEVIREVGRLFVGEGVEMDARCRIKAEVFSFVEYVITPRSKNVTLRPKRKGSQDHIPVIPMYRLGKCSKSAFASSRVSVKQCI